MAKIVTFGEIMLRLATPGHLRFSQTHEFEATFGGGEANVAVSLSNYGEDAHFVTALPDNDIAKACLAELRGIGVDVNHCIKSGNRMGIYYLETGAVARPSKVIYDRAHSSLSEIKPGMIDWDAVSMVPTGFIGQVLRRRSARVLRMCVWRRYTRLLNVASRFPAT